MIPIAKPEEIKSTRPLARARTTNYLRPISTARPRVNALRFAKGRHYRGTLCTRLDLEHAFLEAGHGSGDGRVRCRLGGRERGQGRFYDERRKTRGETADAREARILGPRAPVITANYGRTGGLGHGDRLKAVFACMACTAYARANRNLASPAPLAEKSARRMPHADAAAAVAAWHCVARCILPSGKGENTPSSAHSRRRGRKKGTLFRVAGNCRSLKNVAPGCIIPRVKGADECRHEVARIAQIGVTIPLVREKLQKEIARYRARRKIKYRVQPRGTNKFERHSEEASALAEVPCAEMRENVSAETVDVACERSKVSHKIVRRKREKALSRILISVRSRGRGREARGGEEIRGEAKRGEARRGRGPKRKTDCRVRHLRPSDFNNKAAGTSGSRDRPQVIAPRFADLIFRGARTSLSCKGARWICDDDNVGAKLRAPFTRTSEPVSFNHSEMNHPPRALPCEKTRHSPLEQATLLPPCLLVSRPTARFRKRTAETKRRRHNKQDGLHAGKNRAVYPPIISRRGRSCVAIDIKQTSARLHLEEPTMREGCLFIDKRPSILSKKKI
ncbi:hypothetical protein DBV15_05138 [Temnothorax longispinosus]|uniref:Uncharacterized protein n=1 Tax=Temnothorax longispinosus TaxID=300112 RepID=A0A4S2KZS1_9HYME|nr:hypothetical protein DBV15_05138 [Temnothorax longispinosus]